MNATVMVMQGILAATFIASGVIVYTNREKLKGRLSWLTEYSPATVLFICMSKTAGGLALLLHLFTGAWQFIASAASLGIATIMILAFIYHIRRNEYKDVPATVLFFMMATFLTYYNF